MSTQELTKKVRELKELEAMAEELAAEIEALKDGIKAEMTAREVEEMAVDVYKVRWVTVASRRIDTQALKKAMPELAQQFTRTTETRRFSVV